MATIRYLATIALLLFGLTVTPGVFAQSTELNLKQELDALKAGQEAIQKELQSIKQLLQSRQQARPQAPDVKGVVFDLGDNPSKGMATAPLTLIEFTDYQ